MAEELEIVITLETRRGYREQLFQKRLDGWR